MKHSIEIQSENGIIDSIDGLTKKQAIKQAKEIVYNGGKYFNYEVYISALRKRDNQYLHLNKSGYEIVGKSWNNDFA